MPKCRNRPGKNRALRSLLRCKFLLDADKKHACDGCWLRGHRPTHGNGETCKTADCIGIGPRVARAENVVRDGCSKRVCCSSPGKDFSSCDRSPKMAPKRRNALLLGDVEIVQGLVAYWLGLRGKPKGLAGPGFEPALPGAKMQCLCT